MWGSGDGSKDKNITAVNHHTVGRTCIPFGSKADIRSISCSTSMKCGGLNKIITFFGCSKEVDSPSSGSSRAAAAGGVSNSFFHDPGGSSGSESVFPVLKGKISTPGRCAAHRDILGLLLALSPETP